MNTSLWKSLRAWRYFSLVLTLVAGPAFGQKAPEDRSFSLFLKPMLMASVDLAVVFPNAAVAVRAVNLQRPLGRDEAEARYREGLGLARQRDMRAALIAFHDAADSGYGLAQRKLGDLYGTGYDEVERDYETSLRWYQNARNQGVDIPNKPFVYPGIRR